jgi:hypothetical protein
VSNAIKFSYLLPPIQISKQYKTSSLLSNSLQSSNNKKTIRNQSLIQINKNINLKILNRGTVDKKKLTVIIIYQRQLNFLVLILDESSQDHYLRGCLDGKENTLFSSRSNLLIINVSVNINSTSESKKDLFDQRRRHAENLSNRYRPVHQTQIQGNYEWRFKLNYDK